MVFLTTARFPQVAREAGIPLETLAGQTPWGLAAWGSILAVALFISVALHEFGHALTAQSLGVRVRGITLMMLGGVSQMERMPEARYGELKLAIVGPLVSLILGAVFLLLKPLLSSPELALFAYWIGSANLALGVFNLLPAFPLDGGRALRSVLAARIGQVRATQASVKISKGFAWAMGVIGLLAFNFLLVAIAFFVHTAAQSELAFLLSRGLLKGLSVGDVTSAGPSVSTEDTLERAATRMTESRSVALAVRTSSGAPGVIFLHAIRRVPRQFWNVTLVRDVFDEMPRFLEANEPIGESLQELAQAPMQTLPVREEGVLIGVAAHEDLADILQLRSLRAEEEPEEKRAA